MDEKPRAVADLEEDASAEPAVVSGPLGSLVEREIESDTVKSADTPGSILPSPTPNRSTEYAAGTKEHDDDREG